MEISFLPFPREEIEGSVVERFEKVVQSFPEHLAVKSASHSYTYSELNQKANQIARYLQDPGRPVGSSVAVLLDFSAEIVAVILGIIKAGMVYVVLDRKLPMDQLKKIAEDARVDLLITDDHGMPIAQVLERDVNIPILNLKNFNGDLAMEDCSVQTHPTDPVAIYYTSGTSGKPKGIIRCNQDILFRGWTHHDLYKVISSDVVSLVFLFSFAASTSDMFGALLNGATLSLLNIREIDPRQTIDWLSSEKITIFHPPVAYFRKVLDHMTSDDKFPMLRMIQFGGAPLLKRDIERSRDLFSTECVLVNRLSSTEVGLTTSFTVDRTTELDWDVVPIGYPIEGMNVSLLDEDGNPVVVGDEGEIAVRSKYLSLGYLNNPRQTTERFRTGTADSLDRIYLTGDLGRMRPDGCYEHLGRKDTILKIRGHRVDTSEVEAVLSAHPAIRQVIVTGRPIPGSDEKKLVAYLVKNRIAFIEKRELREFLEDKLPHYMIPVNYEFIETIPLNSNGKTDLSALPEPEHSSDEPFILPRNGIEKKLVRIWSKILLVEKIGINDNFFELGGDSLSAMNLAVLIKKEIGCDIPLTALFEVPTIAHQAELLRK